MNTLLLKLAGWIMFGVSFVAAQQNPDTPSGYGARIDEPACVLPVNLSLLD